MEQRRIISMLPFALIVFAAVAASSTVVLAQHYNENGSIRVKFYTSTKQRDYPMPNESVTLTIDGRTFEGTTNRQGLIYFRRLPCDNEVEIWFRGNPQAIFKRWLNCGKESAWIYYFNSFVPPAGKIEQEK